MLGNSSDYNCLPDPVKLFFLNFLAFNLKDMTVGWWVSCEAKLAGLHCISIRSISATTRRSPCRSPTDAALGGGSSTAPSSGAHQTPTDGISHKPGGLVDIEFLHDVGPVGFSGFGADV